MLLRTASSSTRLLYTNIQNICANGWKGCLHQPGVYTFHGDSDPPPYIGKSCDRAGDVPFPQQLFNKRLRKNRQFCSIQIADSKPQVIYARAVDFSHSPNVFGLYRSGYKALETLSAPASAQL